MTQRRLWAVALLSAIIVTWELSVRAGYLSELVVPRASAVLSHSMVMIGDSRFWNAWGWTLVEWFWSLSAAGVIGTIVGLALGASRSLEAAVMPLLAYLRAVPPIAVFPIALVAIGPGRLPIATIAVAAAVLYMVPGVAMSAQESSRRYRELASVLNANRMQWLFVFVGPSAVVHALASLRIGATLTFAVCIAGEMIIGGSHGVGASILLHSERYELEQAYFFIVCCGMVGLLIDGSVGFLAFRARVREGTWEQDAVPTSPR